MELEELKQKWNKFDEQLSKSEVYNRRMLQELLKGKNQTHYEQMRKQALFNLFTTLFVPVVSSLCSTTRASSTTPRSICSKPSACWVC